MTIRISAIVSTFNAARFLPGCVEDLERQSIADQVEIIVVDSGSEQMESEIIKEYEGRFSNIRCIRTPNRETVYSAWNRGVLAARGRYITNANTDDRHRDDAFERMAMVLDDHPEVALVYADVIKTETENETFEHCTPTGRYRWCDWNRNLLLSKGCFIGPQPMWRRSVHDLYGFFDETLITSGDYEFWLRISQTLEFHHLRETLGLYLESPRSIEHHNRDLKQLENARIVSQYGRAAQEGKIIRLKQLEELESVLWNSSCLSNQKLKAILEDIETLGGLRNKDSASQHLASVISARNYINSKNRILQGDISAGAIDAILQAGSKLILSRTKWFPLQIREGGENSTGVKPDSVKDARGSCPGGDEMSIVERMYEAMQPVMKTSRIEDAISALRNIISVFPDFARVQNDLASLLFQNGQRQEALRHYELAAAAAPDNPDFQKMLGDFYYVESARIEDALKLYRKVLALRSGDVQTRMTVGNILVGLQRFEEAEAHYRKVLLVEPQHGEAKAFLRKLEARKGGGRRTPAVPKPCTPRRSEWSNLGMWRGPV